MTLKPILYSRNYLILSKNSLILLLVVFIRDNRTKGK